MSSLINNSLLTVSEVAEILKLSVLTVYKYIKENKLNAVELGRQYRVERTELHRFIASHRVKSLPRPRRRRIAYGGR